MKITQINIPERTIEEFADEHGLEMEVRERKRPSGDPARYYASFRHGEIKDGCCLVGMYGNGATPSDAITDYGKQISLRILVLDAMGDNCREIEVPRIK